MAEDSSRIARLFREQKPIEDALRQAWLEMLRSHKLTGDPVVVWRDGKVAWVSAEELLARYETMDDSG